MQRRLFTITLLLAAAVMATSCNQGSRQPGADTSGAVADTAAAPVIKEESVNYTTDTVRSIGYAAYDESKADKRPIVLIVPEWWGLNDYVKTRARQLAELGYLAFAVDLYGNGKVADNPKDALAAALPFYKDPRLAVAGLEAAWARAKTYAQADTTRAAAIGYCFGGSMVLTGARAGMPFKGVVSFHGDLQGAPPAKNTIKADILVCHGAADSFVKPDVVAAFKKQMDSVGARYTLIEYPGATHAFTNPAATETGKKFKLDIAYNEAADKKSWEDMKAFFANIFK